MWFWCLGLNLRCSNNTLRRKRIKRLNSSNPWQRDFYCHHDRDSATTQRPLSPLHGPLKCVIHSALENRLFSLPLLAPAALLFSSIYFTYNNSETNFFFFSFQMIQNLIVSSVSMRKTTFHVRSLGCFSLTSSKRITTDDQWLVVWLARPISERSLLRMCCPRRGSRRSLQSSSAPQW